MPKGRSGVTADTPDRILLDAGEAYFGIDLSALESTDIDTALAAGTKVGATRGGSTFDVGRSLRRMEADGLIGPTKGMIRRQEVAPVLTLSLLEMTPDNLKNAIAGATSADTGATTDDMQKIEGGPIIAGSYLDNVALIATYGTADPKNVIIVVKNALVMQSPSLGTSDQDESVLQVAFAGTFDPASPDDEPWAIYHPTTIA